MSDTEAADGTVIQALREICEEEPDALRYPPRLEGLLHDRLLGRHREIHLLTIAVRANVVSHLATVDEYRLTEDELRRLAEPMYDRFGVHPQLGLWTVRTWSQALDIESEEISMENVPEVRGQQTAPPRAKPVGERASTEGPDRRSQDVEREEQRSGGGLEDEVLVDIEDPQGFDSIRGALQRVRSGGLVRLAHDIHEADGLVIDKPVEFTADTDGEVIVRAEGPWKLDHVRGLVRFEGLRFEFEGLPAGFALQVRGSQLDLQGIEITSDGSGLLVEGSTSAVSASGLRIEDVEGATGIDLRGGKVTLEGGRLWQVARSSVMMAGGAFEADGTTFGRSETGLRVMAKRRGQDDKVQLTNCTIEECEGAGVQATGPCPVRLDGCEIRNTEAAVDALESMVELARCHFEENWYGVHSYRGASIEIRDCEFVRNHIPIDASEDSEIIYAGTNVGVPGA